MTDREKAQAVIAQTIRADLLKPLDAQRVGKGHKVGYLERECQLRAINILSSLEQAGFEIVRKDDI